MILRKPYAFLIKHFKLIHLLLAGVLGIILYRTNIIYQFLKNYIRDTNYLNLYIEPEITSIGVLIFIMSFLALAIFITIFILMNRKKKNTRFYFISIIYYSLFIIFLLIANSQLYNLLINKISLQMISMVRDLSKGFYISQYLFLFIVVLRGIGFNIKSFDLKGELKELDIVETDREEFEFEVKIDSDDLRMKIKRTFRIAKYIVQENKKMFSFLSIIAILIIIINIFLNIFIYNKVYNEKETFDVGELTYEVLNSYETTKNYSLEDINNKNIYYVVELKIKNNSTSKKSLNLEHISLKINDEKSYEPNTKLYNNFIDLGVGYTKQVLDVDSTDVYILVFEMPKEINSKDKIFRILRGYVEKDGVKEYRYSKVELKPKNLDTVDFISQSYIGETLLMKDNVIGNISFNIESYTLVNKIEHSYKEKINNKEYTFIDVIQPNFDDYYAKKLMNLKVEFDFQNITNKKAISKFLEKYSVIRYIKDKKEYISPFRGKDLTPESITDNVYLEVPEEINNASNIYLDIIIRNKKYTYVLK